MSNEAEMNAKWLEIERRLVELGCKEAMRLNPGATDSTLDSLEVHIGLKLPLSLREFLKVHDGQCGFGLLLGCGLLSVEEIRINWDGWRSVEDSWSAEDLRSGMDLCPEGCVKPLYANRGWIPLSHDGGGNHIGLDFDPDRNGRVAQVIAFGRDEYRKKVIAVDFPSLIDVLIAWLGEVTWNGRWLERPKLLSADWKREPWVSLPPWWFSDAERSA